MKKLFKDLSHTQSRLYRGDLFIQDLQLEGTVVDINVDSGDDKCVKLVVEYFEWNPPTEKYVDMKTTVHIPKDQFSKRFAVYKRL